MSDPEGHRVLDVPAKDDPMDKKDATGVEIHFPPTMNYVGPGTNMERRLKLLKPASSRTGSATYFFPINMDDMVAFEHDLLYATNNEVIRHLADLRFVEYNTLAPDEFVSRLKQLGIKLPKDLKRPKTPIEFTSHAAIFGKGLARQQLKFGVERIKEKLLGYAFKYDDTLRPEELREFADEMGMPLKSAYSIAVLGSDGYIYNKYWRFMKYAEYTANLMYEIMDKYGEFDNKGNYRMTRYNEKEFKQDLESLYRQFNIMGDEQFMVDNYRGYSRLPVAPAENDLVNFNKRIEKIITPDIPPEITMSTGQEKMFAVKSLIGELDDEKDRNIKYSLLNKLQDELKSRNLPIMPQDELSKFRTPEEQYDQLVKYAWRNSKIKDSNTQNALIDADEAIDKEVIKFVKGKVSSEHLARIEKENADENKALKEIVSKHESREGSSMPTTLIKGDKVVADPKNVSKDVEVEVPVMPSPSQSVAKSVSPSQSVAKSVSPSASISVVPSPVETGPQASPSTKPTPTVEGLLKRGKITQDEYDAYSKVNREKTKSGGSIKKSQQTEEVQAGHTAVVRAIREEKQRLAVERGAKAGRAVLEEEQQRAAEAKEERIRETLEGAGISSYQFTQEVLKELKESKNPNAPGEIEKAQERVIERLRQGGRRGAEGKIRETKTPYRPTAEEEQEALEAMSMGGPAPPAGVVEEPIVLPKPQTEPTGVIPPAEQKAAVQALQAERGGVAKTPAGKSPDNLVETAVNPIDRIVDKLMQKSDAQEREEMKALIAFITPSDQTGGIGTSTTNPLIRDNNEHEKKVVIGRGDPYKDFLDNHLLSNTSNLAMLERINEEYLKKKVKQTQMEKSSYYTLERRVPDILTTQRQQPSEKVDFINLVNPPSAYAHGSEYDGYFQPVGRAGNYVNDRDLTNYWGNPSTSFTPIRHQNP